MEPASRRHRIVRECAVVGAFAALAVVGTYPLVRHFATSVPAGGDTWAYYWNLAWVKRALLDLHQSPFFCADLYFPYGASLFFHTLNLLQGVIALPVVVWWGLPAGYNSLVLLSFVLTGYCTYRLARYVLRTDLRGTDQFDTQWVVTCSAFLAGVIFTFSSYRYVHVLGHLDLVSTQWLPLFALFLLKTGQEPGWLNPVTAAVCLAAAALTSPYYLLFVLVLTGLFCAWTILTARRAWRAALSRLVGAVALGGVLLSPVLIPMARLGAAAGQTPNPAYDVDRFSGDLASFVIPSARAPWSRGVAASARSAVARPGTSIEGTLFLGYVPILLASVALTQRAGRGFWLLAFITFSALALGPVLYVAGSRVPAISTLMPYKVLLWLPFGDVPRVPARFVVMAGIGLSMLASIGTFRLLRDRPRWVSAFAIALFGAIVVVEQVALPLPLAAVELPRYYSQLALSADRGGLIEVPIPADPAEFPARMLFQTVHKLPVYGGYLARGLPPLPFGAVPGFGQFVSLSPAIDDVVPYPASGLDAISRAVLSAYNASHLVVDRDVLTSAQVDAARAVADRLFGSDARAYEDADSLAYVIRPSAEPSPAAIWLDTGWSYLERDVALGADGRPKRWRWMADRARVGITSPAAQEIRLRIRAQAFGRHRRIKLLVDGRQVGILSIGPDQADYETEGVAIPGGVTFVDLVSEDGTGSPGVDRRSLSVALYRAELVTIR